MEVITLVSDPPNSSFVTDAVVLDFNSCNFLKEIVQVHSTLEVGLNLVVKCSRNLRV